MGAAKTSQRQRQRYKTTSTPSNGDSYSERESPFECVGTILKRLNWFHRLPDNLKGIAFLMLASVAFSLMALLIKLLGQRLHVTQILLLRQIGMVIQTGPNLPHHIHGLDGEA